MKDNLNISIVIPNWNGRLLLEKNLPKVVAACKNKKNNISEIVIVDDGSDDDSVKFLKENYKDGVKVVVHKINRGFASAVNTGVRTAKGELICLLNNDVIPEEDFLESVIPHFKDEKVFAVSLHERGYGPAKGKFINGFIGHEGIEPKEEAVETFWASGGSAVFRRSTWMELKGFNEELFPFYWEDVDLSYRAHKRGYRILWEPQANVVHEHETTYRRLSRMYVETVRERNQLLFIWKNLTSKNLFKKHLRGLLGRMVRHPGYIRIFLLALLRLRMVLRLRAREKKEAKLSDEAVFAMF